MPMIDMGGYRVESVYAFHLINQGYQRAEIFERLATRLPFIGQQEYAKIYDVAVLIWGQTAQVMGAPQGLQVGALAYPGEPGDWRICVGINVAVEGDDGEGIYFPYSAKVVPETDLQTVLDRAVRSAIRSWQEFYADQPPLDVGRMRIVEATFIGCR